jgi:hypothetical protein
MKVPQVSVFLENRRGRLHEACDVLAKAGISMITLALADTADFGVMRFIVADPGRAAQVLKDNGFTAIVNDVLAIEVPDRPGGLAEILEVLDSGGVNIEYIYAFAQTTGSRAVLVFRFSDPDSAMAVLQKAGINMLRRVDLLTQQK